MKYLLALVAGILVGAAGFFALMYANPFSAPQTLSPLAVSDQPLITVQYEAAKSDLVFFTYNGESRIKPHPENAAVLWEKPIRNTRIEVAELTGLRGESIGIGVKFSTDSENTRILNSEMLVDSAWHLYLPGRGTLFASQVENFYAYARDIMLKARINSANSWRGAWTRIMTVGPNPIGTGRVVGGTGSFAGITGEVVETINATAYSADEGPVAVDGILTIALPEDAGNRTASTQ